jgi:hypothetical protein
LKISTGARTIIEELEELKQLSGAEATGPVLDENRTSERQKPTRAQQITAPKKSMWPSEDLDRHNQLNALWRVKIQNQVAI